MGLSELLMLGAVGLVILLWAGAMRAREAAVAAAAAACTKQESVLLDDTVALARIGIGRDPYGHLHVRRIYRFEFADGDERRPGSVALLGTRVLAIHLAGHHTLYELLGDRQSH